MHGVGAADRALRLSSSLVLLLAIAVAYVVLLAATDSSRSVFARIGELAGVLPVILSASLVAYLLRFLRWRWLLMAGGYVTPAKAGFLAYLSGFAFTASPGKVGELLRLRYFAHMGVPHARVISCFVFERLMDLAVLLLFASLIATQAPDFGVAVGFVTLVLVAVIIVAHSGRLRRIAQYGLHAEGLTRIALILRTLHRGIVETGQFLRPVTLASAAACGILAWGTQCASYSVALGLLGIELPWPVLFAVPPASMLIGAASMVPGGIGTTEAATVVLLASFGIDLDRAVLAAIALRLGSIYFAIAIGIGAAAWLEMSSALIRQAVTVRSP